MKSEKKTKKNVLFSCFNIMSVHRSKEKKNENHRFLKYSLKMGTSPKSSIFHSIYIHTLFSRYSIDLTFIEINFLFFFRFHFSILFPVLCPRFVSPLCLPVVSPPGGDPNATSRGERFAPTRARVSGKWNRAVPGRLCSPCGAAVGWTTG